MLKNVYQWGTVVKEALSFLQRMVMESPERLPPEIAGLPPFATQHEAQNYLRQLLKEMDDWIVVALWARFESVIEASGVLPKRSRKALLKSLQGGKSSNDARSMFPWLTDELCKKVEAVYKYRNWVAHGRRFSRPAACSSEEAYELLAFVLFELYEDCGVHRT
jgi:hypothetical protein